MLGKLIHVVRIVIWVSIIVFPLPKITSACSETRQSFHPAEAHSPVLPAWFAKAETSTQGVREVVPEAPVPPLPAWFIANSQCTNSKATATQLLANPQTTILSENAGHQPSGSPSVKSYLDDSKNVATSTSSSYPVGWSDRENDHDFNSPGSTNYPDRTVDSGNDDYDPAFGPTAITLSAFIARPLDKGTVTIQVFLALFVSIALMIDLAIRISRRRNIDR